MRKYLLLLFAGGLIACTSDNSSKEIREDLEPEENRFVKETFLSNLDEPTELEVLPDGRILFVQRKGEVILYDPKTLSQRLYDSIPVHSKFEDGLMGLSLDPNFDDNRWVYLYYSPVGDEPKQHLSRFRFTEDGLRDEIVMLVVDTQRDECCHTGGSIEFGGDGLLYLSTGDDTNPFASDGYGPMDERPGRAPWDAQGSSGNTNDLRGKILRIRPLADGSYAIPDGNLFEDDDPLTRPEIYVMGCRNPYRIGVDSRRGWLYWGDVGPDARDNRDQRGTRGYDEFNLAKGPGYYGWPYFVGPNSAYYDYDFLTQTSGPLHNPEKPFNDSPNNTGLKELPPANPALVYYPYANFDKFPMLGNGSRNAMAGPIYYSDDYSGDLKFPTFFDGRAMYYDWVRGHLFSLGMSEEGEVTDWYRLMENTTFNNPIDFDYGPDGKLYFVEYGTGWFSKNENATLSRINYIRGNRPPVLEATTSKLAGKEPLEVTFDASKSFDYDGDNLYYAWEIDGSKFSDSIVFFTFEKQGIFYPKLTIRDPKGHKISKQFTVTVGNSAPEVKIQIAGNQSFYWSGRVIDYNIAVKDEEDGKLDAGIARDDVDFAINHYQSFDQAEVLGHQSPVKSGKELFGTLDCKSCHQVDAESIGPSYVKVAERYPKSDRNRDYLIGKIINGGSGVWGERAMAAHPDLSEADASKLVEYIFSLGAGSFFPLKGTYDLTKEEGNYQLTATYQDRGKDNIRPITSKTELWLKSSVVRASTYDVGKNIKVGKLWDGINYITNIYNGSHVGFEQLDLTDIESIRVEFEDLREGEISIRLGSDTGNEVGRVAVEADETDQIITVPISSSSGAHDIYFVFINQESDAQLFSIRNFEFVPKEVTQNAT